jgi:hypothetical protein
LTSNIIPDFFLPYAFDRKVSTLDPAETPSACLCAQTIIAERFQAMVMLGRANSRMKDFYALPQLAEFNDDKLPRAIAATLRSPQDRSSLATTRCADFGVCQ